MKAQIEVTAVSAAYFHVTNDDQLTDQDGKLKSRDTQ